MNTHTAANRPLLRAAAIQMTSTDSVPDNLQQAAHWLAEAAAQGAQLAVLPENMALMHAPGLRTLAAQEHSTNHLQQWLAQQARQHGMSIVGGTIPTCDQHPDRHTDQRVHATCFVFDAQGQCLGRYHKLHLFDVEVSDSQGQYRESDHIVPGNDVVSVTLHANNAHDMTLQLGLSICYDLRFPELYRTLASAGAALFTVPSAFTHVTGAAHWETLLRARAIENHAYVIGANQCGWHDNKRRTWGHSMIIDPWGTILACAAETPGVIVADIDNSLVSTLRQRMPVLSHRRFDNIFQHTDACGLASSSLASSSIDRNPST